MEDKNASFISVLNIVLGAVLLAFIISILNISTTSWWDGYLGYFGVSINDIDFSPKIFDFATIGLMAVIFIVIGLLISVLSMLLTWFALDRIQKRAAKSKWSWVRYIFSNRTQVLPKMSFFVIAVCALLCLAFQICYPLFEESGRNAAKIDTSFSILEETDENIGVAKRYDKKTQTFDTEFEIKNLVGEMLRYSNEAIKP